MNKIFMVLILFFSFIFFSCEDQLIFPDGAKMQALTPIQQKVTSSSEIFGFKLFKEISNSAKDKNIFISPLSVSVALGMTLNGANGTTYESIREALELNNLNEQEINEAYKSLTELLANSDPKVVFNIANSIWYRNTMTFLQEFINTNEEYFNAEVSGLDFSDPGSVDIINEWVSLNTNGKIETILDKIPSEAVMYLLNALYFNADWKYKFDKEYTKDDYFISSSDSIPCKMMEQKNYYSYYSNDLFQAVDLPYGDSLFSMTIFLPQPDKDINEIIEQFNETSWHYWQNNFKTEEGHIWLPKFEIKYELKLNDALTVLGMGNAFSPSADFTRMNSYGGIWISEVRHKTFIKVDEEGTEAAAVTIVEMIKSVITQGFKMRMNRPFIYLIRERTSNTILFIGKMVNTEE